MNCRLMLALAPFLISACLDRPERDEFEVKIALCSAGINNGLTASLKAELAETLKEGATISADLEQRLRGAYFDGADQTDDNVAKSFDSYLQCIKTIST